MSAKSTSSRVTYDYPAASPANSPHWERIGGNVAATSKPNEKAPSMINSHQELIAHFKHDVESLSKIDRKEAYLKVAKWSCVIGYCEALTTHKDPSRRYSIFPIPIASLVSLVHTEFMPLIEAVPNHNITHRQMVQSLPMQYGNDARIRAVRCKMSYMPTVFMYVFVVMWMAKA